MPRSDIGWRDLMWLDELGDMELARAHDHLRGVVADCRRDLGLPQRNWAYEDLGLDRVRHGLLEGDRIMRKAGWL